MTNLNALLKCNPNLELAKRKLSKFVSITMPSYTWNWHHTFICKKIQNFFQNPSKNLIISVPPQHGKSQLSSRHFPAWALGVNPDIKIALASYNHTVASKFNRDVQRIIDTAEYNSIFPDTQLFGKNVRTSGSWLRNADEFEIVNHLGSFVSVGVGGGLTSRKVDLLIIDDIYKDSKEAWSPIVRENVWDWYISVASTRLHNNSKILIVFTRWHEDDLAGRILKNEPEKWEVINLPAIKVDNSNNEDHREIGEALWESLHSRDKILSIRKNNPIVFENLYQGNPKPKEGLLYGSGFGTYEVLPQLGRMRRICYIDVADEGKDFLCAVCALATENYYYVLDVLHTDNGSEYSLPLLVDMLQKNDISQVFVESNAGGSIYAKTLEEKCKAKDYKPIFIKFHQSTNKEARIFTAAPKVLEKILMPINWHSHFPIFYEHIMSYSMKGKNAFDDAVDALTGLIEKGENVFINTEFNNQKRDRGLDYKKLDVDLRRQRASASKFK